MILHPTTDWLWSQTADLQPPSTARRTQAKAIPAELDIVFNSGLPNSCSSGQILEWNGTAWVCAAQDQGSVTSVGLSAPASDFVVGNSPITTSGTLNLAWKVAPTSASTPNAIVKRDASGNFAAQAINASFLSAG